MTYQEESKINDCTDCPDVPSHCQLNICSNENQGLVMEQQQEDSSSWRSDHVLIDEIEEFKSIDAQQEEEDKKSPSAMRSASPTSTIIDDSDIEEKQTQQQNSSSTTTSSSTLRRSVSWREEIITDVIYRPRTNQSEKRGLYYNSSDMQRFRQHYKMQVRAAQDYQKRLRKDAVRNDKNSTTDSGSRSISKKCVPSVTAKQQQQQQQHHLYTSPITGLINRMTGYLARTSSSSLNTSASATSSPTVSIGTVADTCVLVDTLYLF